MKKIIPLLLALFFGFGNQVNATIIDFRSSDFTAAHQQSSFDYAPAGLTINPLPQGAELYHDSVDGLGVIWDYEYDEVEGTETLHFHFNTPQVLHQILITDLFYEPYNDGTGSFSEQGLFSFDNNSWTDFFADTSQTPSPATNGELTLPFGPSTVITDIYFRGLGYQNWSDTLGDYLEDHEFSVAEMEVSPIPEPSTMLLLGLGLIGLARFRRKSKKV